MNYEKQGDEDNLEQEITEEAGKNKMIFIMATAVVYCIIMTILCGVYLLDISNKVCYAGDINMTAKFKLCL